MKDFGIRVKNLSTHRFPLGTDPAKECFVLNVAAHKLSTAVPGFRRLPLESSVSYDKEDSVHVIVYVLYRHFPKRFQATVPPPSDRKISVKQQMQK